MTRESKLKCPICFREGLADIKTDESNGRVVAVTEGFAIKNKTEVVCSRCRVVVLRPGQMESDADS
jgi:hypothetical protein